MEKLTIAHLAPYLPYGLKIWFSTTKGVKTHTMSASNIGDVLRYTTNYKPILRPLSRLTQEIEHNGGRFVPSREINKMLNNGTYQSHFNNIIIDEGELSIDFGDHAPGYSLMDANKVLQKLFEWRFDVFGLLDSGLAIEEGGQG